MAQHWFISPKFRQKSTLTIIAAGLAFAVILLGAYTRLTDAGLSCPDWPQCYGYLTAPHTPEQLEGAAKAYPMVPVEVKKAWTEMVHRYFAGTEGLLILVLAGGLLFTRKAKTKKAIGIGASLIGLLCVQVALGMLTVTANLHPMIVSSHLITGLSLLCLLWWAYLDVHLTEDYFLAKSSPRIIPWVWLGFIIVAAQVALGGWVSTHYATLACVDLPYCNGQLIPALHFDQLNTDLITIHMLHRFGAIAAATYIGLLDVYLFLKQPTFKRIATISMLLLLMQLTLGILTIVWLRPVHVALTHHAIGILLLLTTITMLVKAYRQAEESRL